MFDRNCIVIINGESYKDIDITYIVNVYMSSACLLVNLFFSVYFQHLGINESYICYLSPLAFKHTTQCLDLRDF